MKDFNGSDFMNLISIEKSGKLTNQYGGGQVKTNSVTLRKGKYIVSIHGEEDRSVGNAVNSGVFYLRVTDETHNKVLIRGSHTGDNRYELSFTLSDILDVESDSNVTALIQTASESGVNGGVKVRFKAIKID